MDRADSRELSIYLLLLSILAYLREKLKMKIFCIYKYHFRGGQEQASLECDCQKGEVFYQVFYRALKKLRNVD